MIGPARRGRAGLDVVGHQFLPEDLSDHGDGLLGVDVLAEIMDLHNTAAIEIVEREIV